MFGDVHCLKSVRIWSFSGPYFPEFGLNTERYCLSLSLCLSSRSVRMRDNMDQKNSEYGHFLHSGSLVILDSFQENCCDETSNQQLN